MKHVRLREGLKALMAGVLGLAMAFTMATPALAANTNSHTITITAQDDADHTYAAYQVFSGDYSETSGVLSNIEWGTGVDGAAVLTDLKANSAFNGAFDNASSAADVASVLNDQTSDSAFMQAFAEVAGAHLATVAGTSTSAGNRDFTINVSGDGYYLVKDNAAVDGNGAATRYILNVVHDVTVNSKSNVPTVEKKVKDTNDTDGTTTDWQDSADYDLGDSVPFQINGTVATDYANYKTYYFEIQDQQSAGLTFDASSVKVYKNSVSDENLISSDSYTLDTTGTDGNTFSVVFSDLKTAVPGLNGGDKIIVTYNSTLNDQSVMGTTGNPNKARLVFSNDSHGTGHGTTPWDTVIVFTYKAEVNKVNGNNQPLTGADFKLEKLVNGTWTEVTSKSMDDTGTTFTFSRIDDGRYRITETKTPDGYNSIESIYFQVTAEHDTDSANPQLTNLAFAQTDENGNVVATASQNFTVTLTESEAKGATAVVNKSGLTLPNTGDMGTTALYVAGGLAVAGAALVLVSRRIASAKNEQ